MLTKMRESNSFSWSITKTKRYGVALFNFKATRQHEIPLDIGECVHIAEECCGWYRGFSASDKTKKGIFPANYIYIKPFKVDESSSGHDSIVLAEDPISREVVTSLREWHRIASRKIFMKRSIGDEELHNRINSAIMDLISMRMQLINGTLTQDQIRDIKIKITNKLDWGNRILQLDLVPRIEGEIADAELISPIELYDLHLRSADLVKTNSVRSSQTSVTSVLSNYLYLHIRDVNLSLSNPEDSFEIAFSLIDATNQISEKFITKISSHVNNIGKLSLSTVFTDISTLEVTRDLQLHVQVFRVGRMLLVEGKTRTSTLSKDNSANHVRRPYGSAVYSLADVFKADGTEKEVAIKLFSCSNENDYFQLHDMLLRKQTNKLNQLQNSTIIISMKVMTGSNLAKVSTEHPLIFKNVTCLTEKWGFPDIILPGDVRNDLYLTLESGEFEKGGKSIPKNIEAVIALIGAEGIVIKKSVSPGSGSEPITSYNSVVLYHNNNPKWMEPVKLLIPLDVFDVGAHVRFEFRHCSAKDSSGSKEKKVLGFSFIPLSDENGTILRDGTHEMHVYKALDSAEARIKACDPSYYLRIPFGPRDIRSNLNTGSSLLVRSVKECVIIRTLLCSTKLTQNGDLLSLLKWKDDPNMAEQALINVLKLNGEEIVKFLQDILDSLFDMFSTPEGNSTKFTGLVFRVLIHIVLLLEDKKYEQFKPVLDNYICGHFSAALVYQGLLACTIQACDLIKDPGKQDAVQRCFMSLSWIFKFIVQSRILFARATGDSNEERFKQDLFALFASFNRILSLTHDREIIQSQVTLIENLPSTYDELLRVLAPTDLARVIKLTINCLPFADQAPEITKAKLKCISDTIDNEKLFSENEARNQLLDVFCQHFKEHIIKHQELKMSAKLISDILVYLHKDKMSLTGNVSCDTELMVIGLFDVIVRIIIDLQPQVVNPNMIASSLSHSFIVALISLLRLMEDNHFKQLMDLKSRRDRKDILLQIFFVFNLIFKQDLLPVDWMVMRLISNHVVLCSLQELSITMITDFLYTEEGVSHFDANLWNSFFNLSVCFLTQPCLQLENFSAAKRNSILEKYGDMRVQMGFQILSMWEKLGDLKVNFIPSMVPPFLKVTLVPEKELRRATLPIFYDLIDADFRSNGSFKQVESTLIDQLDQLVSENKGDDEFKQLFMTIDHLKAVLLDKVRIQCPPWLDQGVLLINQITKLLELLLDYRHVMDGEENRDKRMSCTVNLLRFYKEEIDRKEMYIRYIYKLADLHLPAENYTEAAYTLKLHADSLSWSWVMMSADKLHGRETMEWQKKESLHLTIIEYFDKGKCWEEGIPMLKELAAFYETKLFDYHKLSSVLKTQARFLDHILNELRPEPEYFRVGFFGHGFPLFLRNKLFIYRGLEYEKIGAFTSRLQNEFPQATIMTKSSPPDEAILSSPCQFIQIVSAKPISDTRPEFDGHEVPEKVTAYYLVNDVKTFVYDRPIHKGPMDKENEFKSLWVERTTLTISSKLPGILRWFEVTQKRVTEVSPLEHACETVENMNVELQKIITSYTSEPTKPISPLSMRLQGVIEAAVNGGVAKYQDAFFNSNYIRLHPDHLRYIKKLKMLILHKVRVLEGGLSLHGRLVPSNMQPLHKRLVERFTVMRHNVKQAQEAVGDYAYGSVDVLVNMKRPSIINQPLPPLPPEAVRSSFDGHYSGPLLDLVTNGRERSEDEIYSVPHDCVSGTPPILPERSFLPAGATVPPLPPSRPRSAGYSSLEGPGTPPPRPTIMPITLENGHPMSGRPSASILHRSRSIPRTTNHPHVLTHQNSAQNFYSPSPTKEHVNGIHMAFDEPHSPAPALPPRTATLERNRSLAGFSYDSPPSLGDHDRPPLPKRTMRKALSVSLTTPEGPPSLPSVLIPIEMAIGIPETAPPPLPSKRPAPPPPSLSFSSLPAVPLSSTETMRLDAPAPDVISIASCSSITSSSTISGSNSSEQPTVSGFTEMESSSNNESSNCEGTEVPALIESELIDFM